MADSALTHLYQAAVRAGTPLKATIELLAPCNLRCPHCYVTHAKKNRLTLPVLEGLFDELAAMGTMYLTLTGGEVGLRKDLFDVLAAARRRHFAVTLLTTGTLFGPREWDRLAELAIDNVRMSVYGVTDCVHDEVTQVPGSFERTMATARGLLERGVAVAFATPVMKTNVREVPEVMALGTQLGVDVVVDANITWTDRGDASTQSTRASFEELVGLFRQLDAGVLPPDDGCDTGMVDEAESPCMVGRISAFVQCTGEVLPCVNWPVPGGNVVEQSFGSIWRDSPVFARARGVTHGQLTGCHGCGDRGHCHPCAAMNLRENGGIERPSETVCQTTAARAVAETGTSQQPAYKSRLPIVA